MAAKDVILTAINFKGLSKVREEAQSLASDALCSKGYVLNICNKVEKGLIAIR